MRIFTPECVYLGDMEVGVYELYRVLQAVGPQIRSVGPRKWSGYLYFCIISLHPNISDTFTSEYVYFCPNVYIFAQVSRSLGWFWSYRIGKLEVNMRHLWS